MLGTGHLSERKALSHSAYFLAMFSFTVKLVVKINVCACVRELSDSHWTRVVTTTQALLFEAEAR